MCWVLYSVKSYTGRFLSATHATQPVFNNVAGGAGKCIRLYIVVKVLKDGFYLLQLHQITVCQY